MWSTLALFVWCFVSFLLGQASIIFLAALFSNTGDDDEQ